ncbi:uncharacterized protein LOC128557241 [Mercenaria mercenaria]|uniref:uncharacterized protein LOC128557241 n=1 Tax=Mercenaria mercenaria TaxID=6596 RepID=UPI00234EDB23|nr:uncharacterized protein LOC128557241 [Mercenaria mercenaria]
MGIQVGDQPVKAIVDTAAQVTIISDKVYNSLRHKPPKVKEVKLMTAGRELWLTGYIVGPVRLKIGSKWYKENVYVAPIEQQMLLGFDILCDKGQSILDMGRGIIIFDGMHITLDVDSINGFPSVSRVTVAKRKVIPPHSVAHVKCKMDTELTDYVIEPLDQSKVWKPRVVREGFTDPVVCVVNSTDRYKLISKGSEIGRAYPVSEIIEVGEEDEEYKNEDEEYKINQISDLGRQQDTVPRPKSDSALPPHLQQVYSDSCEHLSEEQQQQLAQLLIEYQDVFAQDEFDLGNFTAMEHVIETGNAEPVKQRMRRTPVCFAGEEEAHLNKMLKAGVIQESISDWASAQVLIRKRNGTVRWCIDYRALNEKSQKDVFPLPLVDDCLDTLSGSVWFSKLDANSAYWQVPIREEDRKKTAFITKYGLFEHV